MRKTIKVNQCLKFTTVIIFLVMAFVLPSAAMEDAIVAIVNDEVITLQDLHDYLDSAALQLKLEGKNESQIQSMMAELKENSLQRLIEDKLIVSEANRKGMEIREDIINERIEKIKQKYTSEDDFLNALISGGATLTDLRNKVLDQLKAKFLVEMEVKSKIYVNPREVTDYYNAHREQFKRPDRVNLASIFIPHDRDPARARQKASAAYASLKSGTEFSEVAVKYSKRPSIGVIAKGQLLPAIEREIFRLRPNAISSIVPVEDGFYIFKMNGRITAEIATLNQVKDNIRNKLFQMKFRERFGTWLGKLKKDAFIEIKE